MQDTVLEGMSKLRGMDIAAMDAARNKTVPLGRPQSPKNAPG